MAVAEQFRRDEIEFGGIERASGSDQPLVAVVIRHVMRRQQHCVVARRVQMAVRPVHDDGLRQYDTAFRAKVVDDELVMLGPIHSLRARGRRGERETERGRRSQCRGSPINNPLRNHHVSHPPSRLTKIWR